MGNKNSEDQHRDASDENQTAVESTEERPDPPSGFNDSSPAMGTEKDTLQGATGRMTASASTYKIRGELSDPTGIGVHGRNTAGSGNTEGVRGTVTSSGDGAAGVSGKAEAAQEAQTYGVYGETKAIGNLSTDTFPAGVLGRATAGSGPTSGVSGFSMSDNGAGVFGQNTSSNGMTAGVRGVCESQDGWGILGQNNSPSGYAPGVKGETNSSGNTAGVFGVSKSTDSSGAGVAGRTDSSTGVGTFGFAAAGSGQNYGVYGQTASPDGYGLATEDDTLIEGVIDTDETDFVVEAGTVNSTDAQNVILGHADNKVSDGVVGATISGGGRNDGQSDRSNEVRRGYGTIGGGRLNLVNGRFGTVAGGTGNWAGSEWYATVSGGNSNNAGGEGSTVGGGNDNTAEGNYATISGGGGYDNDNQVSLSNTAGGLGSTVGGGQNNTASGENATVAGGGGYDKGSQTDLGNTASGLASTVAGGRNNTASGQYSFAAGRKAETQTSGDSPTVHDGAFVWGDSTDTTVNSSATDEVRFQANGGFVVQDTSTVQITAGLPDQSGTAIGIDGSGNLVKSPSSARYKTNVEPLSTDTSRVLDIEPRQFEYEETGDEDTGLIAEEVEDLLPELVVYDDDGRPESVQYDRLGVFLAPEVRKNRERLAANSERVDELEARIEGKDERGDELEAEIEGKDERVDELEGEIECKDERIDELEGKIERKGERIDELEGRLARLEATVDAAPRADD